MRRQSSQIIGKRIDMNDVPDTELFSAYLDGELTADEQVRVEQILAASPEARQLLEELRALDSTLQGLPQEKLDEDLSARVLEVAERRMLLPDRPFDTGEPAKGGDNKPSAGRAAETLKGSETGATGWLGIPWGEISLRGMLSKRALIWSGVVVATAIIIHFTSPPPKPNQEFARLDKAPVTNAPTVAGEEGSRRSKSEGNLVGPAGSLESRIGDRPAKDERRTATEVGDRRAKAEADGLRGNGKDRKAEDLVRVRQPADHDALSSKEAESLAEPGSTAEREKVAKDSAEKAGADKADQGSPRGAEKPAAAVKFAGGGSPASGTTAKSWPSAMTRGSATGRRGINRPTHCFSAKRTREFARMPGPGQRDWSTGKRRKRRIRRPSSRSPKTDLHLPLHRCPQRQPSPPQVNRTGQRRENSRTNRPCLASQRPRPRLRLYRSAPSLRPNPRAGWARLALTMLPSRLIRFRLLKAATRINL